MDKYREILRMHNQGFIQRSIAASCGCSRNTVAKVIDRVTSSAGGGSSTTSKSGGGGNTTSGSSSRLTTDQTPTFVYDLETSNQKGTGTSHYHIIEDYEDIGQHKHDMDHTHSVSGKVHTHDIEIDDHTHSITIGNHTHTVVIPSHTHETLHGIFTGTRADYVTIKVDGKALPVQIQPNSDFDIVSYLSTDGGGKIQRNSWHSIEIYPNKLTRIEASLISQLFINSRGKGDF